MSIRRSLAFSFLEKYASTAINLASTLVLARLLSPHEIGIFSVGAAVVGILHTLRDFGVTNYLIQEREVDHEKLRTAFTVTLGLSWLFAAVLLLGSDRAAAFYREEGIRQIVWVMAANFLLIPFGSPILALMRRDMQFGRLSAINLASTAVNAMTGIALATTGHGFMSLAWASLAGVATTSGLAFASRPHAFLLKPGFAEWRSVLTFGSYATANAFVGDLRQTAPDLVLGRMLGFEAVGLYSRAVGLITIFNKLIFDALQPVLLPALAEKVRRGEDLRETYLRAMEYVTVLYWPFLVFLAFMADPMIRILLGEQWVEVTQLVPIMCVASAIVFPSFMTQSVLISIGRIKETLTVNLITVPASVVCLLVGSLYDLKTVVYLGIATSVLVFIVTLRIIGRYIPIRLGDLLVATRRSAAVTVSVVAVQVLVYAISGWSARVPFPDFAVAAGGSAIVWFLCVVITRHPLSLELTRLYRLTLKRL